MQAPNRLPAGSIVASAPVRVADVGGWTDTWFAGTGMVCSVAAGPGVEVTVHTVQPASRSVRGWRVGQERVPTLHLTDFESSVLLDDAGRLALKQQHPVLAQILHTHLSVDSPIKSIGIRSAVPAGSSLGTSAAVGVALIAALQVASGVEPVPGELARLAHEAETSAGLQAGVQDHVAAAFGGISRIGVSYPFFDRQPIAASDATVEWLTSGLRTVFLGRHDSSTIHRLVIDRLEKNGEGSTSPELVELRAAAQAASDALQTDNRRAYGRALLQTVDAQRRLHPELISESAQQLIDLAVAFGGAAKVNGAGGGGGSVTLLVPDDQDVTHEFDRRLTGLIGSMRGARLLALRPSLFGVVIRR